MNQFTLTVMAGTFPSMLTLDNAYIQHASAMPGLAMATVASMACISYNAAKAFGLY